MRVVFLQVLLMDNREVLFNGRSLGFLSDDEISEYVSEYAMDSEDGK